MACDLCKSLPLRSVRQLNTDVDAGELSFAELATRYGTTVVAIEAHINTCSFTAQSGYSLLGRLLDNINRTAAERKRVAEDKTNALGAADAMEQYISLIRETRSTILAMEKIKPSEELVRLIVQQVLTPLVRQCAVVMVDEINRFRDDTKAYADSTTYSRLDLSVKAALRRIAMRLQRDTVTEMLPQLRKLFAVQQTDEQLMALVNLSDPEPKSSPQDPPVS